METLNDPCEVTKSLLLRVKHNVSRYYIDGDMPAEQETHLRWIFLQSPGDHPPCDVTDELSFEDRHDRCYVLAEALRQELAAQYAFDPACLYILIDPFGTRCEDTVYVAYLYTPDPLDLGGATLMHAEAVPAGKRFATEDALAAYLTAVRATGARLPAGRRVHRRDRRLTHLREGASVAPSSGYPIIPRRCIPK